MSFKDDYRWNSHLVCLYADTAFALALLFIAVTSTKVGVREVKENIISVFLHGCAHGSLFFLSAPPPLGAGIDWSTEPPLAYSDGEKYEKLAARSGVSPRMLLFLVCASQFVFWAGFLTTMTALPRLLAIGQSAIHAIAIVTVVPPFWFFTYVNTLLFVNIVGSKMIVAARPDGSPGLRGRNYSLYSCLVSLPICVATFAEPLMCDALLIDWGGHLWFDSTIPVSILVFYAVVSWSGEDEEQKKEKEKRGRKLGGMPTGVVIPNDYLHPKRRELLCEGLEPGEVCVTNSTELRMSIEFCQETELCEPGEVRIMIPASTTIELEQEVVIRQGLIVHISSYEGEITISGTKQNRLFRVSGTLYANRVTFKDGYSSTHGGAIHLAHGDAYAYINHCAFIGNDAADGGSVVWNEGVLHMSNSFFSPAQSTIAPIYNDGILHMHPLQEIDDDRLVPIRI